MSSIEKAIRDRLRTDTAILALVGHRIYNAKMTQRPTWPLIVLWEIDKTSELTMDAVPGQNRVRVQVDCWASNPDKVRELGNAVNGEPDQSKSGPLHGFSGPSGGLTLRMVRLLVERRPEYQEESNVWRLGADYEVRL